MRKELETITETGYLRDNSQVSKKVKPSNVFDNYKKVSEGIDKTKTYTYLHTVKLCEELFDSEGEHIGAPKVINVVEIYSNHLFI